MPKEGEDNKLGKSVRITGKIVEHLRLGPKEWFTIQLANNQKITISNKHCELLENESSF